MAECYPQGCPPCTEEISFPENPVNGQRECFHIGKDPNTGEDILKCWVYDQCVPGWRAEGPATAPLQFKGGVDLTKTEAENNITVKEAGDYYIVNNGSADVLNPDGSVKETAQQFLNDEWADLQHPILEGAFILWSGTEWIEIPRPCGESAVQSDWLETDEDEPSFILNKPEIPGAVGNIGNGGSVTIAINELAPSYCSGKNLELDADILAEDADGDQVFGFYEYTWQQSNDGTNWINTSLVRKHIASINPHANLLVEDYTGDPAQFRLQVKFTDLYGNEVIVVSDPIIPVAGSSSQFVTQPVDLDLSTNTTGNFTITHTGIAPATVRWYVNGSLVTGPTTPDIGYTFATWESITLGVTRNDADAGSYSVRVEVENAATCSPLLISNTVTLTGPGPDQPLTNTLPIYDPFAVGSLLMVAFMTYSSTCGLYEPTTRGIGSTFRGDTVNLSIRDQVPADSVWRILGPALWDYPYGCPPRNTAWDETRSTYLVQRIA